MKLCVVTCTGKRPRMLELCARWVRHQTREPDLWIISLGEGEDLGNVSLPSYAKVHRWKPETVGQPMTGQIDTNSKYQIEVMRQVPKGYAAAYFDDDDWYDPDYLKMVEEDLQRGTKISGNGSEQRYCLRTHRWMHIEKAGCNCGAVAMVNEAIPDWIEWLQHPETKWNWLADRWKTNLRNGAPRVSIKNGPGLGHLFPPDDRKWIADKAPWAKLREWVSIDTDHYIELMR